MAKVVLTINARLVIADKAEETAELRVASSAATLVVRLVSAEVLAVSSTPTRVVKLASADVLSVSSDARRVVRLVSPATLEVVSADTVVERATSSVEIRVSIEAVLVAISVESMNLIYLVPRFWFKAVKSSPPVPTNKNASN